MSKSPSALELASTHIQAGRFDQAIALLQRHLQGAPKDLRALVFLADAHLRLNQPERAAYFFERALALAPENAQLRCDYAQAFLALGRDEDAIASYRAALETDPSLWTASAGLAQALITSLDFRAAIAAAADGTRRRPDISEHHLNLARALLLAGRVQDSIEAARRGIALAPADSRLHSTCAIGLTYSDKASVDDVTSAYRAFGATFAASRPMAPNWPNSPKPDRPLKIGYLSPDLREHSVPYFLEPILQNHDPAAVQVHVYSRVTQPDAVTNRLKSTVLAKGGRWIEPRNLPLSALADRMRADGLDILIELSGHAHPGLLGITLLRPAPVIATYLGWATTTGLPDIDWRLVDNSTDPPGFEAHSTEQLARLPGCFLCYSAPPDAPEPELPTGPPVFGSFNAVFKITPSCIRAWSAAMKLTPGSRMIIKASQLEHDDLRRSITFAFEHHGIEASRLDLRPRTDSLQDHLAAYREVTVALDTFPYNGTTTTCEALSMGVPVVTLEGAMHAGRVGKSLLTTLGAPDWVARDEADFARTASTLATDRAALTSLRSTLRASLKSSPLCDGANFTRNLESTYRAMWHDWCRKQSP